MNTYGYVGQNPFNGVDPWGLKVNMILDRSKNTLTVVDLDNYKEGLPMVSNLPSDYKFGGIRDKNGKLIANQKLVVRHVFTGGESFIGENIYRNPDPERLPLQQPMPVGFYDIVDNRGNENSKHADWYRLDAQDSTPFNDIHEPTSRSNFRLHLGKESWGCTTFDKYNQEAVQGWSVVKKILNSTSTSWVKDKRGRQHLNPLALMKHYGKIEVIGKDNIVLLPN